jgi:SAM-dependent methyltransferase
MTRRAGRPADDNRLHGTAAVSTPIAGRQLESGRRRLHRFLLIPKVISLVAGAPHDPAVAWQRYWRETTGTGSRGDVLWDTSEPSELARYRQLAADHLDRSLPLVDLGCGNGRYTRGLADMFPRTLGVDLAPAAVELARAESVGSPAEFRPWDITAPDSGPRLRDLVGEANVFMRGVLHVLTPASRRAAVETIRSLVGDRGRALIVETDFRAGTLDYLEHLGARPSHFPAPLARALTTLPRPNHFGRPELARTFPASDWTVLLEGPTPIEGVPMHDGSANPEIIPGYLAVLEPVATAQARRDAT